MFQPTGVFPALVTPLTEDGRVDEPKLRAVIDHLIAAGVDGLFALGSAGEIYGLSAASKRQLLEVTVEQVAGRVQIWCGASEITTPDCLEVVRMAHQVGGVDAFSVLTPYFMTPSQSELVAHFTQIAASTDLPVLLYANPGRTKVPIAVPTVVELAAVPNIVGVKDSTGDMALTQRYITETPDDFAVIVGNDAVILPGLFLGASGIIASTANAVPDLVVALYRAYLAGDHTRARALQALLGEVRSLLVNTGTFPIVIKEAMRLRGVDAGYCLAPAREIPPASAAALPGLIERLDAALA
ncbi:MAG: 4-hydroxy-tetrahydrodipicolinate synthase [Propioniciclava sp.]|uniref:4-hydroxy-tetrahydrodipicolinate synthase n=1 Tax=Propioniciclava sp. TaxID=2038686 RepID=UPI0039E6C01B